MGPPSNNMRAEFFTKTNLEYIGTKTETFMREQLDQNQSEICDLIRFVLDDEISFLQCLASSYKHANGFDKIVLMQGSNFKLRLHLYGSADTVVIAENVHSHRWPFASSILHGSIMMDIFQNTKSNPANKMEESLSDHDHVETFVHYIYHSDKQKGYFETVRIGPTELRQMSTIKYHKGQTYSMNVSDMHRIVSCHNHAITLMLTGKPVSTTCNLFSPRAELLQGETAIVPYSTDELKAKLSSTLTLLQE